MKLNELLSGIKYDIYNGSDEAEVLSLNYDSRDVTEGSAFVCIRGVLFDGHDFVEDAVKKGATTLVTEKPVDTSGNVNVILVKNTRYALACMSAAWFGNPAEKLNTVGITGTKGKTTMTYMVKAILENAGYKVGLIGTIETLIGERTVPSQNTTPESYVVQKTLREMVDEGCDCVVMEVSSQGIMMHRTAGFEFDIGLFGNIEPDHIGPHEHRDFEHYLECKSGLLQQCRTGIVNRDDNAFDRITEGHKCVLETYGFSSDADTRAVNEKLLVSSELLGIEYDTEGKIETHVEVGIPGKFSVYNSLGAICICRHFDVEDEDIRNALRNIKVKGRTEIIKISDDVTFIIDYAHNAMALENLLTTLREYEPGRLVCIFGCGGNRARARRFEMGEVSGKLADFTIITSDNPRDEDPDDIIEDIKTGINKTDGEYISITDRKEAVEYAVQNAVKGDIIVLAGRGHERYQEIKGEKQEMDEREIVKKSIEKNGREIRI